LLTGCSKSEDYTVKNKLDSETKYVEDLIFKIVLKHAKGEYLEEQINWDYIKGDIQKINSSWSIMLLDLTSVGEDNEKILAYSDDLNNLLLSMANEDEIVMLEKLNSMYEKIVSFRETYSEDKNLIEKNKIKSQVLKSYYLSNKEDYETAKSDLDGTIEKYKELMKDEDYKKENSYNMNKIYILLQEYKNSISIGNLDLIKMKFILTVEDL